METGEIIIALSGICIYIPALLFGYPKAIKLAENPEHGAIIRLSRKQKLSIIAYIIGNSFKKHMIFIAGAAILYMIIKPAP